MSERHGPDGESTLNPVDRSTDPSIRRVGNPDIEPQFTNSLSLDASWTLPFGTVRLAPYYRSSRNGWAEMTTVDDRGVAFCFSYEDVRALYIPVLRHRILLNFHAESDRLRQDDILKRVLEWKAVPRD